jgi:hypothetical protein
MAAMTVLPDEVACILAWVKIVVTLSITAILSTQNADAKALTLASWADMEGFKAIEESTSVV